MPKASAERARAGAIGDQQTIYEDLLHMVRLLDASTGLEYVAAMCHAVPSLQRRSRLELLYCASVAVRVCVSESRPPSPRRAPASLTLIQ